MFETRYVLKFDIEPAQEGRPMSEKRAYTLSFEEWAMMQGCSTLNL